jgi:hypothetical protein
VVVKQEQPAGVLVVSHSWIGDGEFDKQKGIG